MAELSDSVKGLARKIGENGPLGYEGSLALFTQRVCKKLDVTEDQLTSLSINEKMALIKLVSESVIEVCGN